ncbi:MAG: putative porin [Methylophilaceae bacterium]
MLDQKKSRRGLVTLLLAGLVLMPLSTQASERESLEKLRATTLNLIDMLVKQGILSKENAEELVKQAEAQATPPGAADTPASKEVASADDQKVVRVQYVPEFVKNQIRDDIKKEVMAQAQSEGWAYPNSIPEWMNRIEWEGDLRLRFEGDRFQPENATPGFFSTNPGRQFSMTNTTDDRDRWRLRARLGANIKVNSWLTGGIKLTTGNTTDPISPNQDFGNSSQKFSFALDRAYLKADPVSWGSIVGGRFANPFFSTDLLWDPDLAFDGVAATVKPKFNDTWSAFATVGAFPIQENQTVSSQVITLGPANVLDLTKDKFIYAAQAGIQWTDTDKSNLKLAAAFYDFSHVEGIANPVGSTPYKNSIPQFRTKGNNTFDINAANAAIPALAGSTFGLASKFQDINLTGQYDYAGFSPVHVILTGDYIRNIGFDQSEIRARTGFPYAEETDAYQLKLTVGMPETTKRNDWQVFAAYKRLEADSVLDGFTDSDFHLGGTDTKGWLAGASYGLDKNTWLTVRYFSANEISGAPLAIDVLLVDFNAKF